MVKRNAEKKKSAHEELSYSARIPSKQDEAGRLVVGHEVSPKPLTFYRKANDYDYA